MVMQSLYSSRFTTCRDYVQQTDILNRFFGSWKLNTQNEIEAFSYTQPILKCCFEETEHNGIIDPSNSFLILDNH